MQRIVLLFAFAACSTSCLSVADPNQRYERLDCHASELVGSIPNACQFVFDLVTDDDTERATFVENGATEIYAAELNVSLERLGRYSILLSKWDGDWELSAFVGKLESGFGESGVFGREYRSVHFQVPETRVTAFKDSLRVRRLSHLTSPQAKPTRTLEMGETVHIVCLDGASLNAKHLSPNSVWSARRSGCKGHGKIDEFADALFDLAVEFDPKLEDYRFTLLKDDKTRDPSQD